MKKICAYLMLSVLAFTGGVGDLSAQLTAPLGELSEAFTWRSIGPVNISGRVTDVEGLPHPSKTFYVATAAGGVWNMHSCSTRPVVDITQSIDQPGAQSSSPTGQSNGKTCSGAPFMDCV